MKEQIYLISPRNRTKNRFKIWDICCVHHCPSMIKS
jgi:hypothetical protein